MRWKVKLLDVSSIGNTRRVKKFLFLPKCLGDEWRWLETAPIIQRVRIKYDTYGLGAVPYTTWVDWKWQDRDESSVEQDET